MSNSNCNCSMSLIQKQCPRRQFDCHRCAAKLQNSETVWELTVPTFKDWLYHNYDGDASIGETPFVENEPGSSSIVMYSIYQKIPKKADGSLLNCNFEADSNLAYTVPSSSASDAEWPDWVSDYGIDREELVGSYGSSIPFYVPGGFDPPLPSWTSFTRHHDALIHFLTLILEDSNVVTPGAWRISLDIIQTANFIDTVQTSTVVFGSIEDRDAYIAGLGERAYSVIDDPPSVDLLNTSAATALGSGTWPGVYKAPDDFTCPIASGVTYRFLNIIPYDLPPLRVASVDPVIPEGYGQPKSGVIYPLKPDRDATTEGESFDLEDYFAPPYIDVKHVPRSDQDVE
ncbi:hypothetical protein [Gimesia algae]|uniref:Uncharacterized protein n=1 Tax=Gimesia algae TaxID=2527971 RepID=A0A517VMU6_9PLAN|nr:hypothetical protein [Gimesia algae]QDT94351.1 hypothetical protein Pan161_60470 [Gimesia algae]